jgi:hypothetical protein
MFFRIHFLLLLVALTVVSLHTDGQCSEEYTRNLKKSAFVVGVNNYEDRSETLNNAVNDAVEVAAALSRLGFETKLDTNISKNKLTNDLIIWTESLRDKKINVSIFYFAGHGAQIGDDNRLYLADAVFSNDNDVVTSHTYSVKSLINDIQTGDNGINILVLDACRDNPTRGSKKNLSKNGLISMKLPRPGILIGYPVPEGQTDPDGTAGRNSLYATAFVNNITLPNLGIKKIFGKISDEVYHLSKNSQVPFMKTSVGDENDICLSYSDEKGIRDLLETPTAKQDITSFRLKLALTTPKVSDDTLGFIFNRVDELTNAACNRLRDSLGNQFTLAEGHGPDYTNSQCINHYVFGNQNYPNKSINTNITTKVTGTEILVLIDNIQDFRLQKFEKNHHLTSGIKAEIGRNSPDWQKVYQIILQYFYDRREILLSED